jgi:hypothetical protein
MASGAEYMYLRNRVAALVRQDKLKSNTSTLEQAKARGDSRMLWELARVALGKQRPTLPKSIKMSDGNRLTEGATAAATRMNEYDVEKVIKLRERNVGCRAPHTSWPKKSAEFSFSFCNAVGISKVIKALGNTGAVGNDHVPIAVYKKGSNILPQPISHIINTSLRSGRVPSTFKLGIIIPIYKGNGKTVRLLPPTVQSASFQRSRRSSRWWPSRHWRNTSPRSTQFRTHSSAFAKAAPAPWPWQ